MSERSVAPLLVTAILSVVSCGGGGGDGGASPGPTLAFLAGDMGGAGNTDGSGAMARFDSPGGVGVDGSGNVYVADTGNHVIRKVAPTGLVSTLAGKSGFNGASDGAGPSARFFGPWDVAADATGNLYVTDMGNHTIRRITPQGVVSTMAGVAGVEGSADGLGTDARFRHPYGVAIDSTGDLYIADFGNNTIRRMSPAGAVTTLAGSPGEIGSVDGSAAAARFAHPSGIAAGIGGIVYVSDWFSHTVRSVTSAATVSTIAGRAFEPGTADGVGPTAMFWGPHGTATDGAGNVYVVESGNCTVRRISPANLVSTLAGSARACGAADGTGGAARFMHPAGIEWAGAGNLYVADQLNHAIRKLTPTGVVTTLVGALPLTGGTDGPGASARFNTPGGLAPDASGNIYVADSQNHTVRRIDAFGVVGTVAGAAGVKGVSDGAAQSARFNAPLGVAADGSGNVYVADSANHTVRKIDLTGTVSTLAGEPGKAGSADGVGGSARFNGPAGVAADDAGNVFVSDTGNNTVRKISPAGEVITLAGAAGLSGSTDGVGSAARFDGPHGIGVDAAGNVYVADARNRTLRRITAQRVVSTLAGIAGNWGSSDGPVGIGRFGLPQGLALDGAGNVYVADLIYNTIRKVDPAGTLTTLAGVAEQRGFAPGDLPGVLALPRGVAVSGGRLYITLYNGVAVVTDLP